MAILAASITFGPTWIVIVLSKPIDGRVRR